MSGDPAGRLTMNADPLSLRRLSPWLSGVLAPTGPETGELRAKMELAVHEVCMDVIDHAYGPQHGSAEPGTVLVECGHTLQAVMFSGSGQSTRSWCCTVESVRWQRRSRGRSPCTGGQGTSRWRRPSATACARSRAPSWRYRWAACDLTVSSVTPSVSAISRLDRPWLMPCRTACWMRVSAGTPPRAPTGKPRTGVRPYQGGQSMRPCAPWATAAPSTLCRRRRRGR